MKAKDLFSGNASDYATFRPDYPAALFEFIFNQVKEFDTAWDCGTGNGQAAKVLAEKFNAVHATDISDKQMANGFQAPNIFYSVSPAEKTLFSDQQFDLITVAQAAHWFKLDGFYKEVKRVAKPNAVIALWGYGLLSINPNFDVALTEFYKNVIGPYWDPERKLIDQQYQTIPFPFAEIKAPNFHFAKQWDLAQLEGYLTTWSAVQKFIKANGTNPVTTFIESTKSLLSNKLVEVSFPLFMRIGYVKG
jgi:ubiquinone/menaquinone biosynthesis C-methylase UbiE